VKFTCSLFTLFLLSFSIVFGEQRNYLEMQDIHPMMSQILDQHVKYRHVNAEIIRRSLNIYIDQFDPDRLYLLEEEVRPYLELSDAEAQALLGLYDRGDYSVYAALNALEQMAIQRARVCREKLAYRIDELFEESQEEGALREGLPEDRAEEISFADSGEELCDRMADDIVRFLAAQRYRVGEDVLEAKLDRAVALYERRMRDIERQYLFETDEGVPMPAKDREHYSVLHIMKALARSLDAHTAFFDASEAYDIRVRLEKGFQGIGVVLQESIDGVVITSLIEGGPAEKSGEIKPNDRLVEIDGKSIVDEPFRAVLDMIRGKEHSTVRLGLKRIVVEDGEETERFIEVVLKRAHVEVKEDRVDVDYREVDGGILGIIKLYSFYEGEDGVSSEEDIRRALQELHSKGKVKGLILDLRENTGGFLNQAVKVAGLFISNGVVVVSQYGDQGERVFRDIDGHTYYNGPMIVLTSRASASAAEIVAQALQDYGAAIIVGDEQTYGKGTVQHQTVTSRSSTSFFKVTVGKFYTVSGRSTQIRGVQADIIVPSPLYREQLGEKFLDYPLANDRIEASYVDDLDDIEGTIKYWYLKYYTPTLQRRSMRWDAIMEQLREKSSERIAHNEEFQKFLSQDGDEYEETLLSSMEDDDEKHTDLQLDESLNILKDMVMLKPSDGQDVGESVLQGKMGPTK
jgi:carboxyl-terminal processing protease